MRQRIITFKEAIREALYQCMSRDKKVFIMGCGTTSPGRIFGSLRGIPERFGTNRVVETPIAENGMTGVAVGAALMGMHPVLTHQRIDFALLSMDQLINHAAKWSYMFAGAMNVPITIRGIIGRSWGQGAQHSQSLQALFAHVPGLKVVMPATPYDAKGLLIASIAEKNPVIFLEHRLLYDMRGYVPQGRYAIPLGKGRLVRKGGDVTVVAVSLMVAHAFIAAERLKEEYGINIEIIDPRCLRPLDKEIILKSLKRTGRLIVADTGWKECGFSAEVASLAAESGQRWLKAPVRRITLPPAPTPTSAYLENFYYPGPQDIVEATCWFFKSRHRKYKGIIAKKQVAAPLKEEAQFTGPF